MPPALHTHNYHFMLRFVSFRSPYLFYLLTVGVEVVYFHLIKHTPQSVGILWTRDRPVAETSQPDNTNTVQDKESHPRGIQTHDPSKRSAADLRLRPRGHCDQQNLAPTGIRSPDPPALNESLYRLRYPGRLHASCHNKQGWRRTVFGEILGLSSSILFTELHTSILCPLLLTF
jgi:hypothetical protein